MGNVKEYRKVKIRIFSFISIIVIAIMCILTFISAAFIAEDHKAKMDQCNNELSINLDEMLLEIYNNTNENDLVKNIILNEEISIVDSYTNAVANDIEVTMFMANKEEIIVDSSFFFNAPYYDEENNLIGYLNHYEAFNQKAGLKELYKEVYFDTHKMYLVGYVDQNMKIYPSKIQLYKMVEEYIPVGDEKVPTQVRKVEFEYNYELPDITNMKYIVMEEAELKRMYPVLLANNDFNLNNAAYKSQLKVYNKFKADNLKFDDYGLKIYLDEDVYATEYYESNDPVLFSIFKLYNNVYYIYEDTIISYSMISYPIKEAVNLLLGSYIIALFVIPTLYIIILSFIERTREIDNKLREVEIEAENKRKALTMAVAHELKTPLSVIKTYNEGLQGNNDPEKDLEYRTIINNEIEHMDSLILDLLQLSKLESKKINLQLEEIDLVELSNNQKIKLQNTYDKKNASFDISGESELIIKADLKLMMLVYSNILSNAVKNIDDNGKIQINISKDNNYAYVRFINDGPKLTNEEISNVWDTFYTKDKSRKHELGSTGLGLAIVRAILELHDASYGCENIDDGVCFWFKIKI